MGAKHAPLAERLARRLDKSGGPDACWPWMGSRNTGGSGKNHGSIQAGRMVKAHRIAWILAGGPVPDGMCVLHRCDNPPCCNPAHLFLGTVADNNRDRDAKGRSNRAANLALGPLKNASRTACVHGHAYDEQNTGRRPGGERWCRACARDRARKARARATRAEVA